MEKFENMQQNMIAEENLDQISGGVALNAEPQEMYLLNKKIAKSSYSGSLRKTMDLLQKMMDENQEKTASNGSDNQ